MGFLSNMGEKATREWAQNLTDEQIEEQERQGMDMSEYRIIAEEYRAEQERIKNSIDLSMLDKFKKTPHSVDFVDEVAQFNKLSDRKKPLIENAPLVYGKVVQAHYALFKSDPKNKDGGGIVFLFALDDAHRFDEEWLTKTAHRISEMKESAQNTPDSVIQKILRLLKLDDGILYSLTVGKMLEKKRVKFLPKDCQDFILSLSNDASSFCYKLGESLSDGADAWCATFKLSNQNKLPMAQIPHNKIVPFLLSEQPKQKWSISDTVLLIPPAYYTK